MQIAQASWAAAKAHIAVRFVHRYVNKIVLVPQIVQSVG